MPWVGSGCWGGGAAAPPDGTLSTPCPGCYCVDKCDKRRASLRTLLNASHNEQKERGLLESNLLKGHCQRNQAGKARKRLQHQQTLILHCRRANLGRKRLSEQKLMTLFCLGETITGLTGTQRNHAAALVPVKKLESSLLFQLKETHRAENRLSMANKIQEYQNERQNDEPSGWSENT